MKIRIGKTTDYFLSSHTLEGYQSFIEQSIEHSELTIILNGSSAQIRSRICRQVGLQLLDRGYNVELIHGLTNPCDLEGIVVPDLGLVMVDGENLPKGNFQLTTKDMINIDLNQYVWPDKYTMFESKIRDLKEQVTVNLELVYEYLQQTHTELTTYEGGNVLTEKQSYDLVERLAKSLFYKNYGEINHRFGKSLTGEGQVDYYHGLLSSIRRKYFLNGVNYKVACGILEFLAKEGAKAGYNADVYHDFLDTDLIELIIIPKLELAIGAKSFGSDFKELINYKEISRNLSYNWSKDPRVKVDMSKITKTLADVKQLNEVMGDLYQCTIDFQAIEHLEENLLGVILNRTIENV